MFLRRERWFVGAGIGNAASVAPDDCGHVRRKQRQTVVHFLRCA